MTSSVGVLLAVMAIVLKRESKSNVDVHFDGLPWRFISLSTAVATERSSSTGFLGNGSNV